MAEFLLIVHASTGHCHALSDRKLDSCQAPPPTAPPPPVYAHAGPRMDTTAKGFGESDSWESGRRTCTVGDRGRSNGYFSTSGDSSSYLLK